jgi:hypothetical protein
MLLHAYFLMVISILEEHKTFIFIIKWFLGHIMKIKSLRSFETSVTIYQPKWCYIPKDSNLEQHCCHKLNIAKQIQLQYSAESTHKKQTKNTCNKSTCCKQW